MFPLCPEIDRALRGHLFSPANADDSDEARQLLSRGGSTDLNGFMKVVEAQLILRGVPDDEIPARLKQIRDDLSGLGDSQECQRGTPATSTGSLEAAA